MAEVWQWLEERGAHRDVVTWARPFGERWEEAWNTCPRGDWLLGIAARAGIERKLIVSAACACARFAFDYLPESETRPGAAVDAVERWLDGADEPELREAMQTSAEAAIDDAPDPSVAAAAMAGLACLRAIDTPEEAALVVTSAVQAALLDVGDCAMMSAVGYAQSTCADLTRERISFANVKDFLHN